MAWCEGVEKTIAGVLLNRLVNSTWVVENCPFLRFPQFEVSWDPHACLKKSTLHVACWLAQRDIWTKRVGRLVCLGRGGGAVI